MLDEKFVIPCSCVHMITINTVVQMMCSKQYALIRIANCKKRIYIYIYIANFIKTNEVIKLNRILFLTCNVLSCSFGGCCFPNESN